MPVIGTGLHNGAHAALQRYLGQDVVPQIAQHAAGVGQLGAAQVDLAVAIHAYTCCPPKLRPSMWSMLKGLLGEAAGEVG